MQQIFWQLSDDDQPGYFAEGRQLTSLMKELRAHMDAEAESTPEGFIPSGNLSLYWNVVQEPVKEDVPA